MAFNCPHCAKAIPDVVPKERLDSVTAAKVTAENEAKENRRKAAAYDALEPQWQEAQTKLAELPTLAERLKAYETEKIDSIYTAAGVTNDKVRKLFQMEFDEQAASETGEKDLGKWIAATRALPADQRPVLLAPFLSAPAGQQPPATPAASPAAQPRPNALPVVTPATVATPPAPGAKLTAQQISAQLAEINQRFAPATMPTDPTQRAARIAERNAAVEALKTAAVAPAAT